ncbi:asparagine synthase (glutamine-hydrolyzing) [Nibrella viscosa]|uniref:asparagine synthase (glutamine-hydrolyzing) n=1 Tax=Nibrella viscosa TaxID=1084524 RepID=A0ABP8KG77_9BACT
MCGIAGIVGQGEANTDNMLCSIRHRGPDDEGLYTAPNLTLFHTRLSILDLSPKGHQPMQTPDGRYVIIFNGEIYNHLDIRSELSSRFAFRSTSDTETLLYGFAAYGTALFNRLNGIFTCAIYDSHTRKLVLARDQFGVKPLYYYHKDARFIFSSELKTIAGLPGIDKTIDYTALVNYLHFLYSPGEQTPFVYARKLLPGHYVTLSVDDPQHIQTHRYYEIPFAGQFTNQTEEKLLNELDEKLYKAVDRQLQSDVPLGFFLSGGLDSSAVVAMARRARPTEKLTCYTIRTAAGQQQYEGFDNDLPYARKVAAHLGVDLIEVEAEADIVRDFDRMIYHLDEPQADTAPINVWNICRQARQNGHTVLLGGMAGDDVFSGYRRHQALALEPLLALLPTASGRLLQRVLGTGPRTSPILRRMQKVALGLGKPRLERIADYFAWLPLATNQGLFQESIRNTLLDYQPRAHLLDSLHRIPEEQSLLNQVLFWELSYYLPNHNLNYTDKLSMAVGVEARVPFLDKELVAFSATLPPAMKMRRTTTKYLLRKLMERYLPHEIVYRSKTGFGTPLRNWFQSGQLTALTSKYLSEECLQQRGLFDSVAVQQLIQANQAGKTDASYTLWGLMAIESWFRQFVD